MTVQVESDLLDQVCEDARNEKTAEPLTWGQYFERIHWTNVLQFALFHLGFFYALVTYALGLQETPVKWATLIWMVIVGYATGLATTAGAHRLWTHRAYKANLGLRIILMLVYSVAGMNSIFHWVKDHRVHHKYSETDADPHNAKRGFFYSHMGWLLLKRHPEYLRRARQIDMSDILDDPVVMFNKKYATELKLILCFGIPTAVPIVFWGETVVHAILTQCFLRVMVIQHFIWSVNSFAHLWGSRRYNKFINPANNLFVSLITGGEGSHNYHHTFAWDYKAAEFTFINFNNTTWFIEAMAKLGWAYDLREASPELVEKVVQRIGYKSEINGNH